MSHRPFEYTEFSYKGAKYRIGSTFPEIVKDEIVKLRTQLEAYIDVYPEFKESLVPIKPGPSAPPIALQMHRAAELARVGPLAAVAGAIAEHSARAVLREIRFRPEKAVESRVIVENGGDIFIVAAPEDLRKEARAESPAVANLIVVSLFAGESAVSHHLAFRVSPDRIPLAICSSSSVMGHSKSFGRADLVTVVGREGALADAAATALCNQVRSARDIDLVLERGMEIPGVDGVLVAIGDRVGLIGDLPELIRRTDSCAETKITRSLS